MIRSARLVTVVAVVLAATLGACQASTEIGELDPAAAEPEHTAMKEERWTYYGYGLLRGLVGRNVANDLAREVAENTEDAIRVLSDEHMGRALVGPVISAEVVQQASRPRQTRRQRRRPSLIEAFKAAEPPGSIAKTGRPRDWRPKRSRPHPASRPGPAANLRNL